MAQVIDSTRRVLREHFGINTSPGQFVIALAGNPNVGKSTVFNALTGLRQHTGNWPGKTVDNAQGTFTYQNKSFLLVDLPGTYSILAHTAEEQIARDFICFGRPDVTLVVLDATCLERNLNLALQVMEMTPKVVICVNLIDEARKKGIKVNTEVLEKELGVPVVATAARQNEGLAHLIDTLHRVATGECKTKPNQLTYSAEVEAAVQLLLPSVERLIGKKLNSRWVALRLLDGDRAFIESIGMHLNLTDVSVTKEAANR
ncbi:FeoB small GTPase domain-containing protein [Sporomusa sp.]|uniref:FeoB small GTPase domain-containing protein n=1 Tax=Sporomusa sp. TaxID=2078658 RepID=UPI002C885C35|nr:FeoB small GTPase domain-containing protein [Sporomusa sp.]HWR41696.1 FeoB small GTPase domain-containing protein [Sporomusa sp.]